MKKTLIISLLLLSTLILSSCSLLPRKSSFPEEYQVKNHSDEKVSTFGLNIASADKMGDRVLDWVSDVTEKEGFHYFICADPDSWDVYLYYPKKQTETQLLTNQDVALEYSDHTLHVYVTVLQPENSPADKDETQEKRILHFMAPTIGAWPSEIRLYWNGSEISCDSAAMTQ